MPRFLLTLPDGRHVEWSTVVDAPATTSMSDAELEEWHLKVFGEREHQNWPERLARLKANGTSLVSQTTAEDAAACNRAGPDETEISLAEIARLYHPDTQEIE